MTTRPDINTRLLALPVWVATALFILLSIGFVPHAGIEDDEALAAGPLYAPVEKEYRITILHHEIPLMMMSYLGTLKTLAYKLVLPVFGNNVWSLRLPAVLMGAITVFLFYLVANQSVGPAMAAVAALLLAADPVFLLTNTFDWGPVALEHLLLMAACVLLVAYNRSPPRGASLKLAGAFFCLGLALWNKAIFVWALSGLTVGGLIVFWPEIRRHATRRNLGVALASFALGALPFLLYNIRHPNRTLSENAHLDVAGVSGKWLQLKIGLNGSALFGFLVNEEWAPSPKAPATALEKTSVWLRDHIGERRESYFYYTFGALLLTAPWWWRRRAARFSLLFTVVTWCAMAVTHDAGGAAHHVVLLWPFPILFAVVALDALPWREIAVLAGSAMVLLNLSVVNQYRAQFARNGAAGIFSDAIFPLSEALSTRGQRAYILDWGIYDVLVFLDQGRLDQRWLGDGFDRESPDEDTRQRIQRMFADPHALLVDHVKEREVVPKVGERLDLAAESLGYRKEIWRTINDSNGRPVFEVWRVVPRKPAPAAYQGVRPTVP